MKAVCDSSILISLSLVGQFRLLDEMFDGVFISPGVYDEVVSEGKHEVTKALRHREEMRHET